MMRAGRFDNAEIALRTVLAAHAGDPQTEFLLGVAIHKQKRYEEARGHFLRVIATRQPFPEVDSVFYLLGWCDYYLGDGAEARLAFEEYLRRVPNEPDAHFGLGLVAFDDDRLDDAERNLAQAIALQEGQAAAARDLAKARARLADVLVRVDRLAEAERELREAVRLHPDHYEAWAKLARVLDRLERPEDAAAARTQEQAAIRRMGREGPAPGDAVRRPDEPPGS